LIKITQRTFYNIDLVSLEHQNMLDGLKRNDNYIKFLYYSK